MTLSIIITAYNTEKYIKRCLDSVKDLDIDEYEVIVVDDGSTDLTKQRVLEQKDPHIEYKYKANGGLRSARICGIGSARGKYIAFLDSDDWVDEGYYEWFINMAESNPEISVCSSAISRDYPDGGHFEYHAFCEDVLLNRDDAIIRMVLENNFKWELASKMYRRELFEVNLPDDNICICEDLDWNWVLMKGIKLFYHTSKKVYHYCVNEDSMTQKAGKAMLTQDVVYNRILRDDYLSQDDIREYFRKAYIKMMPRHILEECTSQETDRNLIEKYQNGFREYYADSTDVYIDREMAAAILGDTDVCIDCFNSIVDGIATCFAELNNKYNHIFVYGNGFIADYLSRWQDRFRLNVEGYVVSDGQPIQRVYRSKKTYYLSEISYEEKDTVFVIALVKRLQSIIVENLENSGINNYCCIDTVPFSDG